MRSLLRAPLASSPRLGSWAERATQVGRNLAAHPDLPYYAALTALWLVMAAITNPVGEFPLNDDWSFAMVVRDLVERHQLRYPQWFGGSFMAQLFIGYLFCLPFGFSFTALRIASLTLGLVAVLCTYVLARQAAVDRRTSWLCAATVAVNPLVFQCANTFMTDVPFLAFMLLSMVFAVRGLRMHSWSDGLIATAAAIVAILIRQTGLLIPGAVLVGMVVARKTTLRRALAVVIGGALVVGSLKLYERWLRDTGQFPPAYGAQGDHIIEVLTARNPLKAMFADWQGMRNHIHILLVFSGLFSLPIILAAYWRRLAAPRGILICGVAGTAAFLVDALYNTIGRDWLLPFSDGYNLYNIGLGPLTLTDTYLRSMDHVPQVGVRFWWWATVIGVGGGCALVYAVVTRGVELLRYGGGRLSGGALPVAIMLAFSAEYTFIMLFELNFDRYLIPLFPALAIVVVFGSRAVLPLPRLSPRSLLVAVPGGAFSAVAALALAYFAVTATHDYLAWNRARWKALRELTTVHRVSPDQIDGGFEYNGTIQHDRSFVFDTPVFPDKSWWWVVDDEYRVTFGEMPGYQIFQSYPFSQWMPPRTGQIHVLKRLPRP